MSRNSDMVAFLLGAVAGATVALLFAPDKGSVTRGRIRQGATDVYGRSKDWVGDTAEGVRSRAGEVVGKTKGVVQDVTGAARHQMDAVKGAVSEGKEAYRRELEKS